MYTSDIENQQHRSLLEHQCRQIANVDVVKNNIVVMTTKLSPPPRWLATIKPYSVLGGLSGRCCLRTAPYYSAELR